MADFFLYVLFTKSYSLQKSVISLSDVVIFGVAKSRNVFLHKFPGKNTGIGNKYQIL